MPADPYKFCAQCQRRKTSEGFRKLDTRNKRSVCSDCFKQMSEFRKKLKTTAKKSGATPPA